MSSLLEMTVAPCPARGSFAELSLPALSADPSLLCRPSHGIQCGYKGLPELRLARCVPYRASRETILRLTSSLLLAAAYGLSVAWSCTAILILLARGPHAEGWVGWGGNYSLKKPPPKDLGDETAVESPVEKDKEEAMAVV